MNQKRLKEIFDYDSRGFFITKIRRGKCKPGSVLKGTPDGKGYKQITVDYKVHRFHRLVFLWHHGFLPVFIDHKNRRRSDNRIENLRAATNAQNGWNKRLRPGYKGVHFTPKTGRFRAKIRKDRQVHIGYFATAREAALAYDKKARELFGSFASLNFP